MPALPDDPQILGLGITARSGWLGRIPELSGLTGCRKSPARRSNSGRRRVYPPCFSKECASGFDSAISVEDCFKSAQMLANEALTSSRSSLFICLLLTEI